MTDTDFDQPFPLGKPNDAYAQYFIGRSFLAPLVGGSVPVSNVSFEPGCRNNWHIHHGTDGGGDQILMCTAGSGWYQADGEDPISMELGSVVRVPAGTKHWHGAKADAWFLSTKLAAEIKDYDGAVAAIDGSLQTLGLTTST